MDIGSVIKQRLQQLGFEQRDLAEAAEVTESYVSQLLTRKKLPPAPERTDIYEKMGEFLNLPSRRLAKLALAQRKKQLQQEFKDPPNPLFTEFRELVLGKCAIAHRHQIRDVFEHQSFGELERLIFQKILDIAKKVISEELDSVQWLNNFAKSSDRNVADVQAMAAEFLLSDVISASKEQLDLFLSPLIEFWDFDLSTFAMTVQLNKNYTVTNAVTFEFIERSDSTLGVEEPGFVAFLQDSEFSADATEEELLFLRRQVFTSKAPGPLYYYRALQNLRDPVHFRAQ